MNLNKWNQIENSFYMKDNLHIAGIHTAMDILRFAVFFLIITILSILSRFVKPLSLCVSQISKNPRHISLWVCEYCHTQHSALSGKIWQVPAGKMEPRSGIISSICLSDLKLT